MFFLIWKSRQGTQEDLEWEEGGVERIEIYDSHTKFSKNKKCKFKQKENMDKKY